MLKKLWIIPAVGLLGVLSFAVVFPLWWLAQNVPEIYSTIMIALVILGITFAVILRLRKKAQSMPPERFWAGYFFSGLIKIFLIILTVGAFGFAVLALVAGNWLFSALGSTAFCLAVTALVLFPKTKNASTTPEVPEEAP